MLAAFEKVVWIATVIAILCVGGAYAYLGGPSMVPSIERTAKVIDKKSDFVKGIDDKSKEIISKPPVVREDPKGKGKNSKKKKRAPKPKQHYREVNKATLEGINNFNRAFKEAKKVKSEVKDGGLRIFDFGKSSIAATLGFEEDDVIQGINGEAIDFASLSSTKSLVPGSEAHKLYDRFLDQAQSGGVIRIDLERRGNPHQIFFKVTR